MFSSLTPVHLRVECESEDEHVSEILVLDSIVSSSGIALNRLSIYYPQFVLPCNYPSLIGGVWFRYIKTSIRCLQARGRTPAIVGGSSSFSEPFNERESYEDHGQSRTRVTAWTFPNIRLYHFDVTRRRESSHRCVPDRPCLSEGLPSRCAPES